MNQDQIAALFVFPKGYNKDQIQELCERISQRLEKVSKIKLADMKVENIEPDYPAIIYQP